MSESGAVTLEDGRYLSDTFAPLPGGGKLYYEDRGTGAPIVTLNNFNMWAPMWREALGDLVDDHRLISYDLRDQGASEDGGHPAGIAEHAQDLLHLLDHIGVERVHLLSSSISALIARDFALAHPERVAGQILVGPALTPNGGLRRKLFTRTLIDSLDHSPAALVDHLYSLVFSDQAIQAGGTATYLALREVQLHSLKPDTVRAGLLASIAHDDDPADLARMAGPLHFIVGDGDFLWSPSMIEDALALVPGSTATTVPRAGHLPFFEQPGPTQAAVREFVARTRTAR